MKRELGLVREALEGAGMDLSYAYEDLVFLSHTGFLLQFTDWQREMLIHTNVEARNTDMVGAIELLQSKGTELGLVFSMGKQYRLTPSSDGEENIQLEFC